MPAVLVHGVPDTAQLWDRVRAHLERRALGSIDQAGALTQLAILRVDLR